MKQYYIEVLREILRKEQDDELRPTMKELSATIMNSTNPSSINNAFNTLQRQGLITREYYIPRSIRITDKGRAFLKAQNNDR